MTPTTTRELAEALRSYPCECVLATDDSDLAIDFTCERCKALATYDAAPAASAQQDEGYPGIAHDFETAKTQLRAAQHFFESPRSFSQEEFREVGRVVMGAKEYTGRLPDCVPDKAIDPFDAQQAVTRVTDADVERGLHDWYRGDPKHHACAVAELERAEQRIAELEKKLTRAETCIVAHAEREHDSGMRIAEQNDKLAGKQARIDALMLEYCPDEMTPEQLEEWGSNQRPAGDGDSWKKA